MSEVLARLAQTLEARKGADPSASYVASLYARGLDAILKKVGEEATEAVIAAKGGEREAVVRETADLFPGPAGDCAALSIAASFPAVQAFTF